MDSQNGPPLGQSACASRDEQGTKESTAADSNDRSPPKRSRWLTPEQLEALPDVAWLIEGLILEASLLVVSAQPKTGKTFLVHEWACCLATGEPWNGRPAQARHVVYICAEGHRGMKERARAWREARGKTLSDMHRLRYVKSSVDLLEKAEVRRLVQEIKERGLEPGLIVVDTLARCFGAGDENAQKDMNAFVAGADELRAQFSGCTVVVVHHMPKGSTKTERGSGALSGAADTVLRLTGTLKGVLTLECAMQKEAEPFPPLKLRGRPIGRSIVLEELHAGSLAAVMGGGDPRAAESEQSAIDALRSFGPHGATSSEWMGCSGMKKTNFHDTRKRLVANGRVMHEGRRYRLAEPETKSEIGPEEVREIEPNEFGK